MNQQQQDFITAYVKKAIHTLGLPHNFKGAGLILFDYDYESFVSTGVLPEPIDDKIETCTGTVTNYLSGYTGEDRKKIMKSAYTEFLSIISDEYNRENSYNLFIRLFYILDKTTGAIKGVITHEQLDYNFDKIKNYYLATSISAINKI